MKIRRIFSTVLAFKIEKVKVSLVFRRPARGPESSCCIEGDMGLGVLSAHALPEEPN